MNKICNAVLISCSFFVQAGQQVGAKAQGAVEGVKNATGMNK